MLFTIFWREHHKKNRDKILKRSVSMQRRINRICENECKVGVYVYALYCLALLY